MESQDLHPEFDDKLKQKFKNFRLPIGHELWDRVLRELEEGRDMSE